MNFVFYNQNYARYRGLPDWARSTLEAHRQDLRSTVYSRPALEAAETHDPWGERAIFGNVRYMNDRGLRRKFDIDRYIRRITEMQ